MTPVAHSTVSEGSKSKTGPTSDSSKVVLKPVRSFSPFPDLLPRSLDEIKSIRQIKKELAHQLESLPGRCVLPYPYVDDDECDEFEDNTIDVSILNLSENERFSKAEGDIPRYLLGGPKVEGTVSPILKDGLLYRILTADGSWFYYNDTQKYEMHIKLTFTSKSNVEPGPTVKIYRQNEKELTAALLVLPGATAKLFSGKIRGYSCKARAVPLNDEHREEIYGEINDRIADDIITMADHLGINEEDLTEEKVISYCTENKTAYTDVEFRPCDYSLYRPELDPYRLRYIPWNRPTSWIPPSQHKEIRLFRREISPMHVQNGSIGNTYLASAMAALAEHSQCIRDLFRHPVTATMGKLERSIGAYWITMNFNGWWLPVLLDDFLPSTLDGPEFTRCGWDIRRLWVALLEKGYAKVHGSYSNIASGDPLEPLTEWTGFPVTRYESYWREERDEGVFDELLRYYNAGYLQMLCTPTDNGDRFSNAYVSSAAPDLEKQYDEIGLRLHHGYAVLQVQSFENGLKLIQFRNPWGTGNEWTGAWSKDDQRWADNPEVLKRCYPPLDTGSRAVEKSNSGVDEEKDRKACEFSRNCLLKPDNTFWMEWGDARRIFYGGGCCHLRPQWFDYRIRGVFEDQVPSVSLQIHVSAVTQVYLLLTQQDERDDITVPYSALLLEAFRRGDGSKARLLSTSTTQIEQPGEELKFNFSREVGMGLTLRPEDCPYFIVPRVLEAPEKLPYVLGVLPETYVGNGLRVEFKKISRECKVFNNMPVFSFKKKDVMTEVTADFQVRTPRQPIESSGVEILDERLREFGVYSF